MKTPFLAALLGAAVFLSSSALQAACTCDPDLYFTPRTEWSGPLAADPTNVDVNLGNDPTQFVRAAYWQIAGVEPDPAFVSAQVNKLTTTTYWRRIDTVNTILSISNTARTKLFSDPWTSKPIFNSAPCKNQARDIGAVFMMFFNCPGGVNCNMQWANTHTYGMNASDALYNPTGYADPKTNSGFFERELMDARYAGLQFFLPNLYGPELGDGTIANLVTALNNIAATSITAQVQVGLFDDTSVYNNANFNYAPWNSGPDMASTGQTNASATKIFNNKWKPYFNAIPSQYWYRVNGRPLIYFYNGGTLGTLTNSTAVITAAKGQFYTYFGVSPWVAVDNAFFASAGMTGPADSKFTWKTVYNAQPNNKSSVTLHGVTLEHAMVKWDNMRQNNNYNISITAKASDEMIKDTSYLSTFLNSTLGATSSTVLVLATWNDLGEGTGINRNYDYYFNGAWQPPDVFMSLIRASQSGQTCPPVGTTATNTPAISPTPSITLTVTPVVTATHGPLVADNEQTGTNDRTLWNGGAVVQYKDSKGTTSDHFPWGANSASPPGTHGSPTNAACYAGTLVASSPTAGIYPYSFLGFELAPSGSANAAGGGQFTDLTPYSPNHGVQFDYYAVAGVQYQVEINTQQVLDYSNYAYQFSAASTGWHTLTVYFPGYGSPSFAQPSWGSPQVAFDQTKAGSVIFQPVPQTVAVAYSLCIDNLTFNVEPAPSATPTVTPSPTRSATPSLTATPSPSASATATPSRTNSASMTPSITPTSTNTGTITPSSTITVTALGSYTETPTFSVSPTQTPTASETPTWTFSSTASPTLSETPTSTPSLSETASATPPDTATPTASPSASPVATSTPTPTMTLSSTFSPTATLSFTLTQTPTGPTATPVPIGSPVPLAVVDAVPVPNPQEGALALNLAVDLTAPAQGLELRLYTPALSLVGTCQIQGSYSAGWNQVTLPLASPLAAGVYFGRVVARSGKGSAALFRHSVKVVILP